MGHVRVSAGSEALDAAVNPCAANGHAKGTPSSQNILCQGKRQPCSSPSTSTVRQTQYIKIAQKLCPGGDWEPRLCKKNLRGRRPHTFLSLFVRNLGPQTPSGHNCCAILLPLLFTLHLGVWADLGRPHIYQIYFHHFAPSAKTQIPTNGPYNWSPRLILGATCTIFRAGTIPKAPGGPIFRRQKTTLCTHKRVTP
jgi:hypothetical protein